MLLKAYIATGAAVCLWFAAAAALGWKAPSLGTGNSGASGYSGSSGGYFSGGRYSSGSGGWGGGK